MKNNFYSMIILLATLLVSSTGFSFGLGIVLFGPTGVTFKSSMYNRTAVDGAFAMNSGHGHRHHDHDHDDHDDHLFTEGHDHFKFLGQLQYIIHHNRNFYYGLGGRLKTYEYDDHDDHDDGRSNFALAGRVPLGLRGLSGPIEYFGELGFMAHVVPHTHFNVEIGIGARFHFN